MKERNMWFHSSTKLNHEKLNSPWKTCNDSLESKEEKYNKKLTRPST